MITDIGGKRVQRIGSIGSTAAVIQRSARWLLHRRRLGSARLGAQSRPAGGNLTGFNFLGGELMPKQLELLSDLVPEATLIALLVNPNDPNVERFTGDVQKAAGTKGLQLHVVEASNESEIDAALASLGQLHASAVLVAPDLYFQAIHGAVERHGCPKARLQCRCQAPTPRIGAPPAQGLIAVLRPGTIRQCRRSLATAAPTAENVFTGAAAFMAPQIQFRISTSLTDVTSAFWCGSSVSWSLAVSGSRYDNQAPEAVNACRSAPKRLDQKDQRPYTSTKTHINPFVVM
jgi:hypothetical protein